MQSDEYFNNIRTRVCVCTRVSVREGAREPKMKQICTVAYKESERFQAPETSEFRKILYDDCLCLTVSVSPDAGPSDQHHIISRNKRIRSLQLRNNNGGKAPSTFQMLVYVALISCSALFTKGLHEFKDNITNTRALSPFTLSEENLTTLTES